MRAQWVSTPPEQLTGVFWFTTATAFLLAATVGANHVANNFGASVGSGAISMRSAIVIDEVLAAVTLGSVVSDTIVGALAAGALFLMAATCYDIPVSTTHAVVGAVIGMTMVGAGPSCVRWSWPGLASISASWVLSPVFSGVLSTAILWFVQAQLLGLPRPLPATFSCLPSIGGATLNLFTLLHLLKASSFHGWSGWIVSLAAAAVFVLGALLSRLTAVPYLREACRSPYLASIHIGPVNSHTEEAGDCHGVPGETLIEGNGPGDRGQPMPEPNSEVNGVRGRSPLPDGALEGYSDSEEDRQGFLDGGDPVEILSPHGQCLAARVGSPAGRVPASGSGAIEALEAFEGLNAEKVFMYLQVMAASLKSYAHGANDTANAMGPYSVIQVMETVGSGLTGINFSRGF